MHIDFISSIKNVEPQFIGILEQFCFIFQENELQEWIGCNIRNNEMFFTLFYGAKKKFQMASTQ